MSDSNLDILLDSLAKFMTTEIEPHLDAIDLYPLKPLPFDLYDKVSSTGIFELAEADEEFSTVASLVAVLSTLSASSAGIGAFVAYCLAGGMIRKLHAPALASRITALAIFEENEVEFDRDRIEFSLMLNNGLVNGMKKSVLLAPVADLFGVFVMDGASPSIAWIKRDNCHLSIREDVGLLGIRGVPCADVLFNDAKPLSIAKIEISDIHYIFALLSLLTASCACATSTVALEKAYAYARDRYQGGRQIHEYDAIKLMYLKNTAAVKAATAGVVRVSESLKPGDTHSLTDCLYAKVAAGEASVNAALDAIQIHGGYGYMRDYGVEKRFRDATTLSMLPLDGTRTALICTGMK